MVQHTFNTQFSTGINPCINKTIHTLLMNGFGTLKKHLFQATFYNY